MRIGMMLRSFDELGGIGVYTRNLVRELLDIDQKNQYVLFYREPANLGRFRHFPNVREQLLPGKNRALWDQWAVPRACLREKIDLIFHPKFTVPLLAPCKAVMVVHGADWFIPEQAQFYGRLDRWYIRTFMPLYFKKASLVISVSRLTTDNFRQVLRVAEGKIETIYFGPARHFKRVTAPDTLQRVRQTYSLPDRFILTLTKQGGDGRKNLGRLLEGYRHYHERSASPLSLVVGGQGTEQFRHMYGVHQKEYGREIHFTGWIEQEDLPAVYSLADLYLYPSNLEAFPIPLTEAMACGTPIITSGANGLQEIAGDAAVLVCPEDVQAIAGAIERVASDDSLRKNLSRQGLERSKQFTWEKCARETIAALEGVAGGH